MPSACKKAYIIIDDVMLIDIILGSSSEGSNLIIASRNKYNFDSLKIAMDLIFEISTIKFLSLQNLD